MSTKNDLKDKQKNVEVEVKKTQKNATFEVDFNLIREKNHTLNDISDSTPVGRICGNIYSTKDYNAFKLSTGRKVNKGAISKLKKEIQKDGQLVPIIVNTEMSIIDGKHRLLAIKELGLEAIYIIRNMKNKHIAKINNTIIKWNAKDYSNFFSSNGFNKEIYQLYNELFEKYNTDNSVNPKNITLRENELKALILNVNSFVPKVKDKFEKGKLKFVNSKEKVVEMLNFVFIDVAKTIDSSFANERKVQRTIFQLLKYDSFDKNDFIKMLKDSKYSNSFISAYFNEYPQQVISDIIVLSYNKYIKDTKNKNSKIPKNIS